MENQDCEEKKQWRCTVCGYIHDGEAPPNECPLCHVPKEKFVAVGSEEDRKILREKEEKKAATKKKATEKSAAKIEGSRHWKCKVCQYVHDGEQPPAKCPVCGAGAEVFVEVDNSGNLLNSAEEDTATQDRDERGVLDTLGRLIVNFHIHPIMAHFPNGILPVAVIFLAIGLIWKTSVLEDTAYYNLIAILVTLPAVIYAGFVEWKRTYMGAKTTVFITKIICGFVVLASVTALVVWPLVQPGVRSLAAGQHIIIAGIAVPCVRIYLGIALIGLGAAGIAGHLGGNLVFGKKR